MRLLDDDPDLDLYDKDWVIHTRSEERAPAKVGPTAQVHKSLISHGCVINGMVVNSVLSPGVQVDVGAVVRDSIVMFDSVIRSGAVVDRAILDKEVVVGSGAIVGDGPYDDRPNKQEPGPPQHRHHGRRQARGHPSRRPDRAQREGRRRRPLVRFRRPRRAQRRVGRPEAARPRRAARPARARSRPRSSRRPSAVGRARPRRPRQEGRRRELTLGRTLPAISARLRGPCHPPNQARPPCARPMSRAGSADSA